MAQTENRQRQIEPQKNLPVATATPAVQALHRNFLNATSGLRQELVRTIFYLHIIYTRNVYRLLGFSSIAQYALEAGGLNKKQCQAFLKIGAKMVELPPMAKALEKDLISWRKAALIADTADPQNITDLIDSASQLPLKELAKKTGKEKPNSSPELPPKVIPEIKPANPKIKPEPTLQVPESPKGPQPEASPVEPEDKPCYINFRLSPEQYSHWSAAMAKIKNRTKEEALVEGLGMLSANQKSRGASHPNYLLVIHQCSTCQQATLVNNRGTFVAPKALLESAQCDAIIEDAEAKRKRNIPPRLRRAVLQAANHTCQNPKCQHTHHLEIHHRLPVAQGGQTTLENLMVLCSRCHRALHQQEEDLRKANRDPLR